MSSAKWRQFFPGGYDLMLETLYQDQLYNIPFMHCLIGAIATIYFVALVSYRPVTAITVAFSAISVVPRQSTVENANDLCPISTLY